MGKQSVAIITPSYAADFDRCQLLCDSMDAFVSGHDHHYILVADADYKLFKQLAGNQRSIVRESDILPDWLHPMSGGLGKGARKLWVSYKTLPMRGWHVQQLRRMAIAGHVDSEALLYCDSDMLFVKNFNVADLWQGDKLRLYVNPQGILEDMGQHRVWCEVSTRLLGLPAPQFPADDYINNLVSWRREKVLATCNQIENHSGRDWVSAIGRNRTFSECQIYGAFIAAKGIENAGHFAEELPLCQTCWFGDTLNARELAAFMAEALPGQVAIGIQSFIETDTRLLRQLLEKAA